MWPPAPSAFFGRGKLCRWEARTASSITARILARIQALSDARYILLRSHGNARDSCSARRAGCERPGLLTGISLGAFAPPGRPSRAASGVATAARRCALLLRLSTAAAGNLSRERHRPRVAAGVLVVAVHAQNDRVRTAHTLPTCHCPLLCLHANEAVGCGGRHAAPLWAAHAVEATTLCTRSCHRMHQRLQPHAPEAATDAVVGCLLAPLA